MIIRSKAPVRISFGGGGTDVSPYPEEKGGCVLSTTITKYVWGTLEVKPEKDDCIEFYNYTGPDLMPVIKKLNKTKQGTNVFMYSDVPPRSGLGGSAASFVALIGLFNNVGGRRKSLHDIAREAYEIERFDLMKLGGRQDQYASAYGGLNFIEFNPDGTVKVTPMQISRDCRLELEKGLVLVHVSKRAESGEILTEQISSYERKEGSVVKALDDVKAIALEMKDCLLNGNLYNFGEMLHKEWESKKKFSSMITNSFIDDLYNHARKYGAIGGKITGAGGGGHMIFYCEPNKEQIVKEKLRLAGATVIDFSLDESGLQTWEV